MNIDEFWAATDRSGDCWQWTGRISATGYGYCWIRGVPAEGAHRVAYLLTHGSIPPGMQIDHTCHTRDKNCRRGSDCPHRSCVNPDHLEAVTPAENVARSRTKDSTVDHCKNGHELTDANTYLWTDRAGLVSRVCRTCNRNKVRRFREREQERRLRISVP